MEDVLEMVVKGGTLRLKNTADTEISIVKIAKARITCRGRGRSFSRDYEGNFEDICEDILTGPLRPGELSDRILLPKQCGGIEISGTYRMEMTSSYVKFSLE